MADLKYEMLNGLVREIADLLEAAYEAYSDDKRFDTGEIIELGFQGTSTARAIMRAYSKLDVDTMGEVLEVLRAVEFKPEDEKGGGLW